MKNEVQHTANEESSILHTLKPRKANWIGHILRRNCLMKNTSRRDEKTRKNMFIATRWPKNMGCQLFCGKGPRCLLWASSWTACGKIKPELLCTFCNIYTIYTRGRGPHYTIWRVAGWRPCFKQKRRPWDLEALNRSLWKTRFEKCCGPVERQATHWMCK